MSGRIDPAAYVAGLLAPTEAEQARRHEREDPRFAAEVRELRAVAARLDALDADAWEPEPPPPLRVEAIVPAARTARRPRLRELLGAPTLRLRPGLALAASLLLVGLGVAGGLLLGGGSGEPAAPQGQVVALDRFGDGPQGAGGRATVADVGGTREVTIDAGGLAPNAAGTHYEVWMIRDPEHMVSLGTFTVGAGGRALVTLPVTADPADFPIMDVSIERADGKPGHSGHSILRSPETTPA